MRSFFGAQKHAHPTDAALLLLRLVTGVAMAIHGYPKMFGFGENVEFNGMKWMGADSWAPGWLQFMAALAEFGGGIAIALGLLTRLSAFGMACTMGVAVYTHAWIKSDPFVANEGGSYEKAAVYLAISLLLLAMGAGRHSADRALFGPKHTD
ncbi:MAG: DoxX family protein [Planctomycetota bacterium]